MVCPFGGNDCVTSVIDSRKNNEGIRRRRECSTCGLRFTTYEKADISLMVQKNSGDIEEYTAKLETIKESYFNETKEQSVQTLTEETDESTYGTSDPIMSAYAASLGRLTR